MQNVDPYAKINNVCLLILTAIGLTLALSYTKAILIPFVFAIFLYEVATPKVVWLQRQWKMPRMAAVILTTMAFFLAVVLIVFIVIASLEDFLKDARVYKEQLRALSVQVGETLHSYGIQIRGPDMLAQVDNLPLARMAGNITGSVVSLIANSLLVFVFFLFLIVGERRSQHRNRVLLQTAEKISQYVTVKFLSALVTGILCLIVYLAVGVDLAFMFGILTVLLSFIPSLGAIVSTLLPAPVLLLQYGLGWQFVLVLTLTAVIQIVIGNVYEPKYLGDSMDLHPVTILICLVFWGIVWGIPGMFLAVPITAVVKILLSEVKPARPFAELLAGRLYSN